MRLPARVWESDNREPGNKTNGPSQAVPPPPPRRECRADAGGDQAAAMHDRETVW